MASLEERGMMLILGIGRPTINLFSNKNHLRILQAGFTLIEVLVSISIVSILMSIAVLNIPNHDQSNWKSNVDQLIASMNMVHDESLMNGHPINIKIDEKGWEFYYPNQQFPGLSLHSTDILSKDLNESKLGRQSQTNLHQYPSKSWAKPVSIIPILVLLGDELFDPNLKIQISQDKQKVIIFRNHQGQFGLMKE
jgi:prepilin-type N-terminal cleavage/methylation domain-containing protein